MSPKFLLESPLPSGEEGCIACGAYLSPLPLEVGSEASMERVDAGCKACSLQRPLFIDE